MLEPYQLWVGHKVKSEVALGIVKWRAELAGFGYTLTKKGVGSYGEFKPKERALFVSCCLRPGGNG